MQTFFLGLAGLDEDTGLEWRAALRGQGWQIDFFKTAQEILQAASRSSGGLVLADASCFSPEGPDGLRKVLCAHPKVSVIIVGSQDKLSNQQIAEYLEAGADDFISRNIDHRILVAKLKAHLRRILPSLASLLEVLSSPKGSIRIDGATRTVLIKDPNGRSTQVDNFTPTELSLLKFLLERCGIAVERRMILEHIWREDATQVNLETVDKHVESIRKKLGPFGKNIRTVYGV